MSRSIWTWLQTGAQALALEKAAVDTGVAKIDAEGSVDFDAGDLALHATLDAPDLAPLGPLAKATLGGKASATLGRRRHARVT